MNEVGMGMNKKKNKENINTMAALPQPYGKAAIFAPIPQTTTRIVNIGDATWEIGVEDPEDKNVSRQFMRGFDVRHAQIIFGLLNHYHAVGVPYNTRLDMSYYKLKEICGFEDGSYNDAMIKDLLLDLQHTTTGIVRDGKTSFFTVIGSISRKQNNTTKALTLEYISFSERFIEMLDQYKQYFSFYLHLWNKLPSRIAQSLYLYLPSRAIDKDKSSAFEITLTKLLDQVGLDVPKYKSKRKEIFEQNKNSIMNQLNGSPVHYNKILRAEIKETADKKDYKLRVWVELSKDSNISYSVNDKSKLAIWWVESGGDFREYTERIRRKPQLNYYETERLNEVGIDTKKDETYLRMAKALIGEMAFSELAGTMAAQAKADKLSAPYPYLIQAIKNEIENTLKQHELPLEEIQALE